MHFFLTREGVNMKQATYISNGSAELTPGDIERLAVTNPAYITETSKKKHAEKLAELAKIIDVLNFAIIINTILIQRAIQIENENREKSERKQTQPIGGDTSINNSLLLFQLNQKFLQELAEIKNKHELILKITELLSVLTLIQASIKKVKNTITDLKESIQENRKQMVTLLKNEIINNNYDPELKRKLIKRIDEKASKFINNTDISAQQFRNDAKVIINSVFNEAATLPESTHSTSKARKADVIFNSLDSRGEYNQRENLDTGSVVALNQNIAYLQSLEQAEQAVSSVITAVIKSADKDTHIEAGAIQSSLESANELQRNLNPASIEEIVSESIINASKIRDIRNAMPPEFQPEPQEKVNRIEKAEQSTLTSDLTQSSDTNAKKDNTTEYDAFTNLDDDDNKSEVKKETKVAEKVEHEETSEQVSTFRPR